MPLILAMRPASSSKRRGGEADQGAAGEGREDRGWVHGVSRASGDGGDDLDRQEQRTVGIEHREDEALLGAAEEVRVLPCFVELRHRESDLGSGRRRRVESRWLDACDLRGPKSQPEHPQIEVMVAGSR